MPKSSWLVAAAVCSLAAAPTTSQAQSTDATTDNPQHFVHDVLHALIGPNWNLFVHGGVATGDRYLLQQDVNSAFGQRALQGQTGYSVGGGAGVDLLLRTGLRLSYTFASRDLSFRTNNGNGSDALDIDDVGTLQSHTAAVELLRYALPADVAFNPYGTIGLQGTWWSLNDNSPLVTHADASTPFSISPIFSFGVQVKATSHWSGRLEATLSGGHNPFTGNRSFRALAGPTIDEPSSINRTDFRVSGVYHFGRPHLPSLNSVAKRQ